MSYIGNILVAVDQFGNALAAGDADNTISARIGYYANHKKGPNQRYWKWLEWIVDATFKPVDGEGHCNQAYFNDAGEGFPDRSWGWVNAILAIIVAFPCLFLFFIIRVGVLLGLLKRKEDTRIDDIQERFIASKRKLGGIRKELNHFNINDKRLVPFVNSVIQTAEYIKQDLRNG